MLKRVSIQNFKSLKDVTLDLQKVNLLIGPNNSGKTNFLKALEFVAELKKDAKDLSFTIDDKLHFSSEDDDPFASPIRILIYIVLDSVSNGKYVHYKLHYNGNNYTFTGTSNNSLDLISFGKDSEKTSLNWLRWNIDGTLIYKVDSNKLVNPYPLIPNNEIVKSDASNIVAYLDSIRDKYPNIFNKIQDDLSKCVPEFTQIRFDNIRPSSELQKMYGDKTYKLLGLFSIKTNTTYWADELSEGTLYFLALLCIIHQPNPPKILMLEEPEKGIHPRRISEIINFIFRLADEKDVQIIMTTHSPIVLDMFKDMPESVFVFDKNNDEGATTVKNLQHDVIEQDIKRSEELGIEPPHYTDSLGDSWTVGFLGGVPK